MDPQNDKELELAKLCMKAFGNYYQLKSELDMEKPKNITVENNPAIEPIINILNQLKEGKTLDTIDMPAEIKGNEGKYSYQFLISLNSPTVKAHIRNVTDINLNDLDRSEENKILIDKISLLPLISVVLPKETEITKETIEKVRKYTEQFEETYKFNKKSRQIIEAIKKQTEENAKSLKKTIEKMMTKRKRQ